MGMGFVFERDGPPSMSKADTGPVPRQFEFRPHYDVALQTYDDLDDLHKAGAFKYEVGLYVEFILSSVG